VQFAPAMHERQQDLPGSAAALGPSPTLPRRVEPLAEVAGFARPPFGPGTRAPGLFIEFLEERFRADLVQRVCSAVSRKVQTDDADVFVAAARTLDDGRLREGLASATSC
jgi:hypothetical protein